jgi:superfamily I DNA/RNA helicase
VLFLARNQNLLGYVSKLLSGERVTVESWPRTGLEYRASSFDWVVVDEGQDLNHLELAELARWSSGAKLAVFIDSNQAILNNPRQVADRLSALELELSINLRNTKAISKVTGQLFEGELPETIGPDGVLPTYEVCLQRLVADTKQCIIKVLAEGLRRGQLSILVDSISLRESLLVTLNSSNILAGRYLDWLPDALTVETVEDFKGLESDYVIAVIEDPINLSKPLSYVAASRARTRLHVITSSENALLVASIQGLESK